MTVEQKSTGQLVDETITVCFKSTNGNHSALLDELSDLLSSKLGPDVGACVVKLAVISSTIWNMIDVILSSDDNDLVAESARVAQNLNSARTDLIREIDRLLGSKLTVTRKVHNNNAILACTHPGKLGDALYALPAIRRLCEIRNCQADFYTSEYCKPLTALFEAQQCINKVVVSAEYKVDNYSCGAQPRQVPVNGHYDEIYHLGYDRTPDRPLHFYMGKLAGVENVELPISYEFTSRHTLDQPYIVIAARGHTSYLDLFRGVIADSSIPVVEVGASGEYIGEGRSLDMTGLDMLDTLPWIANSAGFVGISSAMLVLANGFDNVTKVVPHDGKSWDVRHWIQSSTNHYMVNPTVDDVMGKLSVLPKLNHPSHFDYCRTATADDWFTEMDHIDSMCGMLKGVNHRYEHPMRRWEYGLVLNALRKFECKSVLDVGGGGSVFAPSCAWLDMNVTQVDPGDCGTWVIQQSKRIGKQLTYAQVDFNDYPINELFDAVTCLSVLEHVTHDVEFFRKLSKHVKPGGLLAVTVDYWPDGAVHCDGHIRTYNIERISGLVDSLGNSGFSLVGTPYYVNEQALVNDYTFASLILRRTAA